MSGLGECAANEGAVILPWILDWFWQPIPTALAFAAYPQCATQLLFTAGRSPWSSVCQVQASFAFLDLQCSTMIYMVDELSKLSISNINHRALKYTQLALADIKYQSTSTSSNQFPRDLVLRLKAWPLQPKWGRALCKSRPWSRPTPRCGPCLNGPAPERSSKPRTWTDPGGWATCQECCSTRCQWCGHWTECQSQENAGHEGVLVSFMVIYYTYNNIIYIYIVIIDINWWCLTIHHVW